jgi:DNA-binding MarR family transcriptional regulator
VLRWGNGRKYAMRSKVSCSGLLLTAPERAWKLVTDEVDGSIGTLDYQHFRVLNAIAADAALNEKGLAEELLIDVPFLRAIMGDLESQGMVEYLGSREYQITAIGEGTVLAMREALEGLLFRGWNKAKRKIICAFLQSLGSGK